MAGTHTVDSGFPRQQGNLWMLCGTLEVTNSEQQFAVCGTGCRLVAGFVMDQDGVGYARFRLNHDGSSEVNGSIAVDGSEAGPETYYYTVWYM